MATSRPSIAQRQLPGLDQENRAFWTGGAVGRLMIARCGACATWIHPPLPRCARCGSLAIAPEAVSGRGRVASFTINAQPWIPGLSVPYAFAAVELEEQPELYVFTNIVDCPDEAIQAGLVVRVTFERHEDVFLPVFVPEGGND